MSAIKEAFDRAGFSSSDGKLYDIAVKAMVAHADDSASAEIAIWNAISKDHALLIALFARERHAAIRALLYRVRNDLYRKQENITTIERKAQKIVNMVREREKLAEQVRLKAEREAEIIEAKKYNEYLAQWRATPIGNLEISGTPVWELTPGTVRTWLTTQTRKWKCVELLIEGLPENDRPIQYYRRPEDVAALWRQTAGM